jgi:hypothetical protein
MASHINNILVSFRIRCTRIWNNVKYGILNLIKWFPVIWNDRNWDYFYANQIFIRKLELMRDHFYKENYVEGSRLCGLRINTVINILKKVQADEYRTEYLEYYSHDFNINNDGTLHWDDNPYDNLGAFFDKYPRLYKQALKSLKYNKIGNSDNYARLRIAIHMCTIKQQRASDLAYKIISTNSPGWWD